MNILQAISNKRIFRPFFGEDLSTWKAWNIALRALYGLPIKSQFGRELVQQCTGRSVEELPPEGFDTALFLTGRRSGKSRIASVIAAYESLFGGWERKLAKGERGVVPILSPTRYQSSVVWGALHSLFDTELLKPEVIDERQIEKILALRNGLEVRILSADWRTIRGPTLCCAILDEACYLHLAEEFRVRSDMELIRALTPALLTTRGRLIAISSKYARKGWAYQQWCQQHGSNRGVNPAFVEPWTTLVWDAPSQRMNPTLSEARIAKAYLEDPAAARSEYGGEWRDDISQYIERSLVESLVVKNRKELLPRDDTNYFAFSDLSGGRSDDAGLAIAHKEDRKVIIDFARLWRAPFNPHTVIGEQVDELKRFGLHRVTGDNYAAGFVAGSFKACGIHFTKSELPKSKLYSELLPRLCSAEIELLDNETLVDQIAGLERRTVSGGADKIDHAPNGKDDLANCIAGVAVLAAGRRRKVGTLWPVESTKREIGFISHFG